MQTDRTAQAFQIQPATEIPAAWLEDSYQRMFPERAAFLRSHWRWLYRVGTYKGIRSPLVATLGDQVIGHAGMIPVTLCRNGEERTAIWLVDFAILPEYQRAGIGMSLTHACMSACSLCLGFCNERSLGMVLKCGWGLHRHTRSFQLLLRPDHHLCFQKPMGMALGTLAGFATRAVWHVRVLSPPRLSVSLATPASMTPFAGPKACSALHVSRSPHFLRWRISTHPSSHEYLVLQGPTGVNEGYAAIARLVDDGGCRRLHLLALQAEPVNRKKLSQFFASIIRYALHEDIHVIVLVTSDSVIAQIAKWWLPISKRLRFVSHAEDPAGKEFLSGTDHWWEYIDNDFDLTYTSRFAKGVPSSP
ncbi:MAG: GNAT family N-acetyltransferase [Acidobacteria bacterium]|nr:GNAT family N-acetyltransferase [Acidobacteriota bacterium]MCI0719218.1 GNAT family N-acetyltransferase [Acidobacteriota bacterium]